MEVGTLGHTAQARYVEVSSETYDLASHVAGMEGRTIDAQIEFWAKLGRAAMDNPDLPIDLIRDILISRAQDRSLAEPFEMGQA